MPEFRRTRPVVLGEAGVKSVVITILACLTAVGCAPGGNQRTDQGGTQPRGAKRIVAAVLGEHPSVISKFERTLPGAEAIEFIVAAGLSVPGPDGELLPVLAEAAPRTDNG